MSDKDLEKFVKKLWRGGVKRIRGEKHLEKFCKIFL
jgi:hypothetical protein